MHQSGVFRRIRRIVNRELRTIRHLRFEDIDTFFLGISVKDTSIYGLRGESSPPFANGLQV
jgi:hypothetical protein